MIVNPISKSIQTRSDKPNEDWENAGNYVVDETTSEGQELAAKIIEYAPYLELVVENGQLVDVIPLPKPPAPPPEPGIEDYLLDLDYRLSMIELGLN